MASIDKIKILIADQDRPFARRLSQYMAHHGFILQMASGLAEAKALITNWKPRLVLTDMMLADGTAFDLLDFMRNDPAVKFQNTQILVLSAHNNSENVRLAVQKGAKDYVVKPFQMGDFLRRLILHCRPHRELTDMSAIELAQSGEIQQLLHLLQSTLRQANSEDSLLQTLFQINRMVALKLNAVRGSLIQIHNINKGTVVVSSDDRNATGIGLHLTKYPEIQTVFNTHTLMAIENIEDAPEFRMIKSQFQNIQFNSLVICPVMKKQNLFGVISLRFNDEKLRLEDFELRFIETVSQILSLTLNQNNHHAQLESWLENQRSTPVIPMRKSLKKS